MVSFSHRVPPNLEPNRLAEARARQGDIRFDLTVSNPTLCDLPYPDDLLEELADRRGLRYRPDPAGPLQTRRAVAALYDRWGCDIDPGTVLLTASTSEAYSLLFKLLSDPGDTVVVPSPSYPLFGQLARLEAIRTHSIALDPDDHWRPSMAEIAEAPESTRAVVLVHPNNPTGSFVHPEDAAAIAELCRQRSWALVADEVFLPFVLDGGPGADRSFASTDRALSFSLGGISKSIGLPQLKLAWIVVTGPDDLVGAALDRLDYIADAYLSVSTPVALAAPRLLAASMQVQRAIVDRCRANLEFLRRATAALPAVSVLEVGGGWSVLLRLPAILDDEELALRLLLEHEVAVQPGFLFDLPWAGSLVLSLLTPESVWRKGLAATLEVIGGRL